METIVQNFRRLSATLVIGLLGFGATSATAMPVFFEFSGTCDFACASISVADGTAVSGFIETTDTAVTSGTIGIADVVDFSFTLGAVDINVANGGFVNFSDLGLNAMETGFSSGRITIIQGLSVFLEFEIFDMWRYAQAGQDLAGGDGSFTRLAAVPEPGSLLLICAGLLAGVAGARIRKR